MKIYSANKKADYDYAILEKFEAGVVLFGQEVKSIRTGHINLSGTYVTFFKDEPFLVGVKIPPYQPNNAGADYNEERNKKLLLNKKEIDYLAGKTKTKGFALVPLKIYDNNGRIKLEFALARGKKKYDKKSRFKNL